MKWCLDCGTPSVESRCPEHKAEHKALRNAEACRAREAVAAAPWCHCTSRRCAHVGECGVTEDLTADHLVPLRRGGADGPLEVLCRPCNSRKGGRWR